MGDSPARRGPPEGSPEGPPPGGVATRRGQHRGCRGEEPPPRGVAVLLLLHPLRHRCRRPARDVAALPPSRVEPRLHLTLPPPPSLRREGSFPDPEHEFITLVLDGLSVEEQQGLGRGKISGRDETNSSFLVGPYLNPGRGTPVGWAAFPTGGANRTRPEGGREINGISTGFLVPK
jgi:hypothetical protein